MKKIVSLMLVFLIANLFFGCDGIYDCQGGDNSSKLPAYDSIYYNFESDDETGFLDTGISQPQNYLLINDLAEYESFVEMTKDQKYFDKLQVGLEKKDYNQAFFEKNRLLLVECCRFGFDECLFSFKGFKIDNDILKLEIEEYNAGEREGGKAQIFFIVLPNDLDKFTSIEIDFVDYQILDKKPIIYLYPKEEQIVRVELQNPQRLTHTYPKYEDFWEVLAKPNGDLVDLKTGRTHYALYWEGLSTDSLKMEEGFVIKGKDSIAFLEEKLAILGLNEREANEFIIYWLPQLESNTYNFIRFQTIEEQNQAMPLKITPTPDCLIRVMMEFKPLSKPQTIKEQTLVTPKREGFIAVEWGGKNFG